MGNKYNILELRKEPIYLLNKMAAYRAAEKREYENIQYKRESIFRENCDQCVQFQQHIYRSNRLWCPERASRGENEQQWQSKKVRRCPGRNLVPVQREHRSGYLLSALYLRTFSRVSLSYSPEKYKEGFRSKTHPPLNDGDKENPTKQPIMINYRLTDERIRSIVYLRMIIINNRERAEKYGRCCCHRSHCDSGFFYPAQPDPQISERAVQRMLCGVFRRLQWLHEASCRRCQRIV